jgi:hypothetical protein
MSGAFGDMGNLLKQAQQMQRELDKAREELKAARVEGSAGGVVKVEFTGDGQILSVNIAPEAMTGDAAMLEDLVQAAIRDALARATALKSEIEGKVTGGFDLPGFF